MILVHIRQAVYFLNLLMKSDISNFNGQQLRDENIKSCLSVFDVVKTSLGPISFDKMIINELGDITFTNDGANILKKKEVNHPAAKILVGLSYQQDEEIGDGTTSVVMIACELLKRANDLAKKKIHPSVIISAYRLAMCHSCSLIREKLCIPIDFINSKILLNTAKTSLSSKIAGFNSKKFAIIAVQAVKSVQILQKGEDKRLCQTKAINFIKIHGNSVNSSCLFDGCILEFQKICVMMSNHLTSLKMICLNFELKIAQPKLGILIQNQNPLEVKKIFNKEIELIICFVKKIVKTGINLIFVSKGIDNFVIKYLVKNGIVAVRRYQLIFLKKIALVTGSRVLSTLQQTNFQTRLGSSWVGEAEEFFEQEIATTNIILIRGCRFCSASSIILRGATGFLLEEIAQSLYDAIFIVKRSIEGNKLVTGGGSIETNICVSLEKLANSIPTREQLGILEFAEALLVIPKMLSINAGLNHTEILSKIKILHKASFCENFSEFKYFGIDLIAGKIVNHLYTGVIEPAISKIKCIQIATEAAITLLRIDDLIISNQKKKD
nr:T-complex protein 1 alpha SU [Cryptomonas curvata]